MTLYFSGENYNKINLINTKHNTSINNKSDDFIFNPFCGVLDEDLEQILVPQFNFNEVINQIEDSESLAIEFIGRHGRGKTTHLRALQQKLNHYPIFLLDQNSTVKNILKHKSEKVFIDSIHHLNIIDRIKVLKAKKVVVYTTHFNRKIECALCKKQKRTIRFKGINAATLEAIINKRIKLASNGKFSFNDFGTSEDVKSLISQFGDDYRGIINKLYDNYL